MEPTLQVWKELNWTLLCDEDVPEKWKVQIAEWSQGRGLEQDDASEFPSEDPSDIYDLLGVTEETREMVQTDGRWFEFRDLKLLGEDISWRVWWVHSPNA